MRKAKKEFWRSLTYEPSCYVCGQVRELHRHHVFGAANRKHSEKYGLVIYLCPYHHNMSDDGIHFNKALDREVKQQAQVWFESELGSRSEFRSVFGRSWL